MQDYERRFTNPVLTWGTGLILGILFGLIVLGWWLWPVEWVDAAPEHMLFEHQVEYIRASIEAYGYTGDGAAALQRYESVGANAEAALAQVVQNPGSLPPDLVGDYSREIAGVEADSLAAAEVEAPETTSGISTGLAVLIALFFLLIGGGLTYIILRGRRKDIEPAEIEAEPEEEVFEEVAVIEEPLAPVELAPLEEIAIQKEGLTSELLAPEAYPEDLPEDTTSAVRESIFANRLFEETTEESASEGANLPPFLAATGAAAGLAAAALGTESEQAEAEGEPETLAEGEPTGSVLPEDTLEEATLEAMAEDELFEEAPQFELESEADAGAALGAAAVAAAMAGKQTEVEMEAEPEIAVPPSEVEEPETSNSVRASDSLDVKMRKKLEFVEGIGPVYAGKLAEAGILTTGKLLVEGVSRKGRLELAEKTGISPHLILKWINQIDLYRIKGIGAEYADLLEAAGVDTVPELAQRNAEHLYAAMQATNEQKHLVRQTPTLEQVADWVEQANSLPRIIQY